MAQAAFKKSVVREYFESIVIAVILALFVRTWVVQAFKIPTGSMENNLLIGDHLLVNKFVFAPTLSSIERALLPIDPIRRGDIIVFKYPEEPERDFIKRVIGLPGETLEVLPSRILVDDEPAINLGLTGWHSDLEEEYLRPAEVRDGRLELEISTIGDRPTGETPPSSPLVRAARAAGRGPVGASETVTTSGEAMNSRRSRPRGAPRCTWRRRAGCGVPPGPSRVASRTDENPRRPRAQPGPPGPDGGCRPPVVRGRAGAVVGHGSKKTISWHEKKPLTSAASTLLSPPPPSRARPRVIVTRFMRDAIPERPTVRAASLSSPLVIRRDAGGA